MVGIIEEKLCLALDNINTMSEVIVRVQLLKPYMSYFKIGIGSFGAFGPEIVRLIINEGANVFLDLKFFDIPNTVYQACYEAAKLGVHIMNVHSLGGLDMMKAALQGAKKGAEEARCRVPKVIGVTVLTSFEQASLQKAWNLKVDLPQQVRYLTQQVMQAGLDGIVCAASDLIWLKPIVPESFFVVTPGISNVSGKAGSDQMRVMSPLQAIQQGSNLLVIGRAINDEETNAKRQQVAKEILQSISHS